MDFTKFISDKMKEAPVPSELSPEDRETLLTIRAKMAKAMESERLRQFLVIELNGWLKEFDTKDLAEKWKALL